MLVKNQVRWLSTQCVRSTDDSVEELRSARGAYFSVLCLVRKDNRAGIEMRLNGERISVSLATIELSPTAIGTHLVITEQGVCFDSRTARTNAKKARANCWSRLPLSGPS